jgi:hypothetical protein
MKVLLVDTKVTTTMDRSTTNNQMNIYHPNPSVQDKENDLSNNPKRGGN